MTIWIRSFGVLVWFGLIYSRLTLIEPTIYSQGRTWTSLLPASTSPVLGSQQHLQHSQFMWYWRSNTSHEHARQVLYQTNCTHSPGFRALRQGLSVYLRLTYEIFLFQPPMSLSVILRLQTGYHTYLAGFYLSVRIWNPVLMLRDERHLSSSQVIWFLMKLYNKFNVEMSCFNKWEQLAVHMQNEWTLIWL